MLGSSIGLGRPGASVSNLAVGVYGARETSALRLRIGAAIVPPLQSDAANDQRVAIDAAYTRGLDRLWMWAAHRLTIAPSARVTSTARAGLQWAGEVVVAHALDVAPRGSRRQEIAAQASAEIAGQTGALRAGLRALAVALPFSSGDQAQLSCTPFVGFDAGAVYGALGVLVNLDDPGGFSPSGRGMSSAALSLGRRF